MEGVVANHKPGNLEIRFKKTEPVIIVARETCGRSLSEKGLYSFGRKVDSFDSLNTRDVRNGVNEWAENFVKKWPYFDVSNEIVEGAPYHTIIYPDKRIITHLPFSPARSQIWEQDTVGYLESKDYKIREVESVEGLDISDSRFSRLHPKRLVSALGIRNS